MEDFAFGLNFSPFIKANCSKSGEFARMTSMDQILFNYIDAIIFHGMDANASDLPPPSWRRPHQHYIFLHYEPPANTNLKMLRDSFPNYFNRTTSYRLDSDIIMLHPYGRLKCKDTSQSSTCRDFPRINNNKNVPEIEPADHSKFQIDLSQKNRSVAWFVSNCHADSKRELLVRNLLLHIPVDVYGPCTNMRSASCPRDKQKDCDLMLSRYYRFYLSFENSLCPDYVTEKLYRPMMHDTVPVVYGGSDYSTYLPTGSYIDSRNFSSPLELANYLKKLMVDDDLYLSYFRWRSQYVVNQLPLEGWCQFISRGDKVKAKTYDDIEGWWTGRLTNKTCFSAPPSLVGFT